MTTFEKLRPIIAEALNIAPEDVTESLGMEDIAEWDSMGNMAIMAAIEEKLGVEIPLDDLFELTSVSALVAEIDKLS
ncbi:MAG: acyl carrier protein [Clostridium sp.]|nr:acyl carrier protein [Clostridium sp.]